MRNQLHKIGGLGRRALQPCSKFILPQYTIIMKTNMFPSQTLVRWMTQVVLVLLLCFAQIDLRAAMAHTETSLPFVDCANTYYANASLTPPVSAMATLAVTEMFEDIPGFANAKLSASIISGGATLLVTLAGHEGELPDNAVLGYVTVTDNGVARNFVVHTDGGTVVVLELDL
jgi:hypothetical protein